MEISFRENFHIQLAYGYLSINSLRRPVAALRLYRAIGKPCTAALPLFSASTKIEIVHFSAILWRHLESKVFEATRGILDAIKKLFFKDGVTKSF